MCRALNYDGGKESETESVSTIVVTKIGGLGGTSWNLEDEQQLHTQSRVSRLRKY